MKKFSLKKEEQSFKTQEAYKTLRTNLMFCGDDVKVIVVTSCLPNDGKSYVSRNLAINLVDADKKVLLIDADLRKSTMLRMVSSETKIYGLSHYLSGQHGLEDVIYTDENRPNFDVIFTGSFPPNPSELLGNDKFAELVKTVRERYDYVIIDTPPLGSIIDSAIVASLCDGVIMVIRSGQVSYKFARTVVEQLEKSKCRILGTVLNGYDTGESGRYRKYYRNYYYYYSDEPDGSKTKHKRLRK